jgi:hypothetical protein
MNEEDPDWLRLRYLPLPKVLDEFLKELKITQGPMLQTFFAIIYA